MTKTREQTAVKEATGAERRRTKRIPLSFHIEVSGRDRGGTLFRDRAITSDVNENGCKFEFLWELTPGSSVGISVIPKGQLAPDIAQPTIFQVVWVVPSNLGWSIGATTLRPNNIWHMSFPTKK